MTPQEQIAELVEYCNFILNQRNQLEYECFRLKRRVASLTPKPAPTEPVLDGSHPA